MSQRPARPPSLRNLNLQSHRLGHPIHPDRAFPCLLLRPKPVDLFKHPKHFQMKMTMKRMRILVVGGTGYLGQHLLQGFSSSSSDTPHPQLFEYDLAFTYHSTPTPPHGLLQALPPHALSFFVDLRTGNGLDSISQSFGQPDVVINCAAISVPRACEADPDSAIAINVPAAIVDWLSSFVDKDTLLIHLSSDQVYQGVKSFYKEEDETVPVNVYGKTKLDAEKLISSRCSNYVILRSSIIFGPQPVSPVHKSLPVQWMDSVLSKGDRVDFFCDEFRCPIYVKDLVDVILALTMRWLSDCKIMQLLLNVGGPERLSRVQMAEAVARVRKYPTSLINPVSALSVDRGVRSPADISMDISHLVNMLGISPVHFQEGISFQRGGSFTRKPVDYPKKEEYVLTCPTTNMTTTCPANYPAASSESELDASLSNQTCPDYFRWIHEDLKPWKNKGITREMVEEVEEYAHFRLVIVNGTAYVRQYDRAFQTRDVFTLWGVLQLLRLYPGRLPDIDLMFQCHDLPSINKDRYRGTFKAARPPPLFHYCGSDSTFDIVFPDPSYWGWPEINIKPWEQLVKDIQEENTRMNWTSREPYAFWKGNLGTGARWKLGKCNSIEDWSAAIYQQDWDRETEEGFKNSDISKQCTHRYKIYIEGNAWSSSEKGILACDSMTLLVNPFFYDFFTRSLVPMKHYWPINADADRICLSIKYAVKWGNSHPDQAQEIGTAGSKFVTDELTMDSVYDYMFHVLDQYGKLLTYTPTVPPEAVELCSEKWVCSPIGLETEFKIDSMVKGRSQRNPCTMPPAYDPRALQALLDQNDNIKGQVDKWESEERH